MAEVNFLVKKGLTVPKGSASTPSVIFDASDPNTGLYSPGADQVAVATNGTGRLFVDASGNVGIGTTSPSVKLHVSGARAIINDGTETETGLSIGTDSTSTGTNYGAIDLNGAAYAGIHLRTSNIVRASLFQYSNSSTTLETNGSAPLIFGINSSEKARLDTSGRLLVNTPTSVVVAGAEAVQQIVGTPTSDRPIGLHWGGASIAAPYINFSKSRNATYGSYTIVNNGDGLGGLLFAGDDGTDYGSVGAAIEALVDGTPGTNDMPGRLVFSTTADGASSPTERMRISNNGTVLISCTSFPSATVKGVGWANNSGVGYYYSSAVSITGSSAHAQFINPNGIVGSITTDASATAYNTSSDYRLKENVFAVTDGITRLQQLKPSRFNFITDPDKTVDGFIAHEVQEVVPEAITGEKDAEDANGNPKYQGIDQSKLVPLLTAALQEAIGEIESLKARVTALESA
jgi:hypothetical protein